MKPVYNSGPNSLLQQDEASYYLSFVYQGLANILYCDAISAVQQDMLRRKESKE